MKVETEVWCVKYALTQGLFKVNGYTVDSGRFYVPLLYKSLSKKEFDLTLEGAMLKAEEMRKKKIASLKKQTTQLESLEIKVG
jgi:ABC-type proline/glycine betaine transport system substrate-binding protein